MTVGEYYTVEGDVLDAICADWYGTAVGTLEACLAANPDVADLGPVLPRGVRIVLPPRVTPPPVDIVRLW